MNILVLGNLGPNPDRITAFTRLGHRLVYAYVDLGYGMLSSEEEVVSIPVAPTESPDRLRAIISEYEIHVIYCLLNSYDFSTQLAISLIDAGVHVPVVRHYKEHSCEWDDLERRSLLETTAQIYINELSFQYFHHSYGVRAESAHVMDGDLIAERHMTDFFSKKLREEDGEPHVIVAGAVSTLDDRYDVRELCIELARRQVHVHIYGIPQGEDQYGRLIRPHAPTRRVYDRLIAEFARVHLHDLIPPTQFAKVWSRYDAGILHSRVTAGDRAARFERMNLAHRYSAYLAAGLPLVIQAGGQDAMEWLINERGIGFVYQNYDDLVEQLYDRKRVGELTGYVVRERKTFSFDHHAPHLIDVLATYAR